MPDDQPPDGPDYGWLYGASVGRRRQPQVDPDATQAMPRPDDATQGPRPGYDPGASQGLPAGYDPDATQAIGRPEQPSAGADDSNRTRALDLAGGAAAAPASPSFGGTYAGPDQPRPAEPRYATPVPSGRSQPQRRTVSRTGPPPPPRRPAGGANRATRPPRRRRNWWLRGALLLFLAWLVFLVAVPVWAWSTISKVDAQPAGPRPPDTAGTTYLLVGSDSRAGLTAAQEADLGTGSAAGQRTDTIVLLDVPASGPTVLLSIPRDSYVDIPQNGQNKINAAYALGGSDLLVHTIEKATKIRIDNYIEIGFAGFVDVVDAVGGIQVCPKTSINDPKAGQLKMRKGCQHVDGHTALSYSRSRAFPNGDITRALHQREVIGAVGSQAASWQTVVLPWRYFRLNSAAAQTVQVGKDVSPIDVIRFAWAMAHIGGKDTKRCVVPYSSLGTSTAVGSVVLWDEQKANALFSAIRSGDTSSVRCAPQ